jgi:hypothetical protein
VLMAPTPPNDCDGLEPGWDESLDTACGRPCPSTPGRTSDSPGRRPPAGRFLDCGLCLSVMFTANAGQSGDAGRKSQSLGPDEIRKASSLNPGHSISLVQSSSASLSMNDPHEAVSMPSQGQSRQIDLVSPFSQSRSAFIPSNFGIRHARRSNGSLGGPVPFFGFPIRITIGQRDSTAGRKCVSSNERNFSRDRHLLARG